MVDALPLIVRMVEEQFHRDTEGRPIREGRTPKQLLAPGEIDYRKCPYRGSRHQHANPMNVSALRQTTAHWNKILDALAMLQQGYARGRGGYGPDLRDIWYVSQLGSSLPWFFILRDGVAPPPYAAALAKTALGTAILSQCCLVKQLAERWQPPPITPTSLMELAEMSGTLVGENEVCSASDPMIERFCEVLVPDAPVDAGAICGLANRVDEVLAFGSSYAAFKITVWIYFLARRFLYVDAGLVTELNRSCEPPDFFILEPKDHSSMSRSSRALWFRQLAELIVPFARGDEGFRALAFRIAEAMGADGAPAETWSRLDQIFGEVVTLVEGNFRGARADPIAEAMRDRLLGDSPRSAFNHPS